MKIKSKYFSYSKLLVFSLCLAFFLILFFDAWVVVKLLGFVEDGISLTYCTVIGTVVGTISTFSNAVILFGVKNYLEKSKEENKVGYDARTQTTAEERMHMATIKSKAELDGMGEDNDFGGEDIDS